MVSAQLLFGLSRDDGRAVSELAWRRFLAAQITPRFPAGLTVLAGEGQWRGPDGRLRRERARIVLVVVPETPDLRARLDAVRAAYRARFAQGSVGLVLSRACASCR